MQTDDSSHYYVLEIIYQIVKDDPYPLKYQVHPRELILRSMQDWSMIQSALTILEKEEVIVMRQLDTLQIALTGKGLEWCRAILPK